MRPRRQQQVFLVLLVACAAIVVALDIAGLPAMASNAIGAAVLVTALVAYQQRRQ